MPMSASARPLRADPPVLDELVRSDPPMGGASLSRAGRLARSGGTIAIVLLALLFLSPGSYASPYVGTSGVPAAPHAVPGHLALPAATIARPHSAPALPGSDLTTSRPFDAPSFYGSLNHGFGYKVPSFAQAGAPNPAAGSSASSSAPAAPAPANPTGCPVTSFSGYVKNYSGFPLSGVSVQAYSVNQCLCPQSACPAVSTNNTGGFTVKGPVGSDYLQFVASWYLNNISYVFGIQGITTALNYTVYLVADAVAVGTVEANNSKHGPISGVTVKGISRDLQLIGNPSSTTNGNGYFKIAVPPVPSQVSFAPPYGYLPTFLDVNSTPSEILNLGVIYLDKEPLVTATLYDSVTGGLVPTANCDPFNPADCHSLTVCSSITNACLNQGPTTNSATISALGPLGYDWVKVLAVGYLENDVPIGLVTTPTFNVGKVYMVPMAAVAVRVSVTHNATSLPFGTGLWYSSSCSMNGYSTGGVVPNPSTFTINMTAGKCAGGGCSPAAGGVVNLPTFPLRNDINIYPDTTAVCNIVPTWPIPGLLPVWGNETYVNSTPDMITNATAPLWLNLTPGTYVYGNVTVFPTVLSPTGGFTVQGVSTDNPTMPAYSYSTATSPWDCGPYAHTPTAFCAPVPPGPGMVRVQSLTNAYLQNFTWGSVPVMCCYKANDPMPLWQYTRGTAPEGQVGTIAGVTTVNLTAEGNVYGRVFRGHTNLGVFFGSIQVAPSGSNPIQPTFDGAIYINGSFFIGSATGWVGITASASGYSPNTVWAYVTGNDSVGNISLTPLATLSGQVVDPTGHGIYDAVVSYCPVSNPSTCTPLGAGLSTSDGFFNGTVTGGWLPWATYRIQASASGYTSDWAWVNASAGNATSVPTLTLRPVGINASTLRAPGAHPALSSGAAGVWVDGYLRDTLVDWGVVTNSIQACPFTGLACYTFNITNQDGYLNDSVPSGNYNLLITPAGYYPVTVFFNATLASFVHLGNIPMVELPWVKGYVSIAPFGNITVKHGSGYVTIQLAPGAVAHACDNNGTVCGIGLGLSSQGLFLVQSGGGNYSKIQVIPNGGSLAGSSNGGFMSNTTIYNTTGNLTNLTYTIELTIYVTVAGYVLDGSSVGPGGVTPWLPVRFAPVAIATFGPNHVTATWTTNGGGWYMFFVAPGVNTSLISAGGAPEADIAANYTVFATLNSTVVPTTLNVPEFKLTHFGYVVARISASPNGTAAAYVGVTSSYMDPLNGTLTGNSQTNGNGYLNVTAAPGSPVNVTVGPGSDYNGTWFKVSVNSTATTYKNGTGFWGLGNESVNPWGWIRSPSVNNSTQPDIATVIDGANGLPLPLAQVTALSSEPGLTGTATTTNWDGQFVVDAPISLKDTLQIVHTAYQQNSTFHVIKAGETLVSPQITMTGVGVLAGTVIGFPGGERIPFATIQACPYNSTGLSGCYSATANATGVFWVAATPGLVSITTTASGFVTNTNTVGRSCSDCWNYLQPIVLNQYSYVVGVVRGLPSAAPIAGAMVSACSTLGHPVGACGFTVVTRDSGSFTLGIPAGQYILQANATGYNSSYLPFGLVPGEVLPVGILFLKQFGSVYGQVLSGATLLPVFNASVVACPDWSGGACSASVNTDPLGHFVAAAAPGPYTLTVLAPGFQDAYAPAKFVSGVSTTVPPIILAPLGVDSNYLVGGRVVNGSSPSQGIAGATVAAVVGPTVEFSTQTAADGTFSMDILYGAYTLLVTANGYRPAVLPIVVHGPLTGLLFPMSLMMFNVTGVVTDGLTHEVLPNVAISEGGIVSAVSDINGQYLLPLQNGTHTLVASYQGSSGAQYADLPFNVTVNGVAVVRNLQLLPPSVIVTGSVVDAVSGAPLGGAVVQLTGTTVDGVPVQQPLLTDAAGEFSATLPLGNYSVAASYTGYVARTVGFVVTTAGAALSVALSPSPATSVQPGAPTGSTPLYVLIGAVVVIAVALAILGWMLTASANRRAAAALRPRPARGASPPAGGK